jgi:hypothetical protein
MATTATQLLDNLAQEAAGSDNDLAAMTYRNAALEVRELEREAADLRAENSRFQRRLIAIQQAAA